MTFLWVGLFGVLGVLARYGVSHFPFSTFVINVIGSFCIGLVFTWSLRTGAADWLRIGLMTGFLGGFTTFSAYSLETVELLNQAKVFLAAVYFIGTPIVGVAAAFAGMAAGRLLF